MTLINITYLLYLALTLSLTVWVGNTLKVNGRAFLLETFEDNAPLADSINHLLVVGFYLINVGYLSIVLKESNNIESIRQVIEVLSQKVGWVAIILGFMHFFNLFVFSRFLKRKPKPVNPSGL